MVVYPALGATLGNLVASPPQAAKPKFFGDGGMGRVLAGVIGDALAQNAGIQPLYAPAMRQRQQTEAEEAQWTRRRQTENEDWTRGQQAEDARWTRQQQWKRDNPDPSPMMRDAQAWQGMTPEQRTAYGQMREAGSGDVVTTLPNGQLYIGPKSGIAAALTGGMAPSAAPPAPVGKLRPVGGPTPSASGTFRP